MKEILTIKEAFEGTIAVLENYRYSKTTIQNFKWDCLKFHKYALQKQGTDSLNNEICFMYLKESIDYPFDEKRPLTSKEGRYIRCIRRLLEYQQYQTVFNVKKKEPVSIAAWAANDVHYVEKYIEAMQTADNSENTKIIRTSHICKFYMFLISHDVESTKNILPEHISTFIKTLEIYSLTFTKHILATLRNYFRFLYKSGFLSNDWSYLVPRVKACTNLNVPELWEKEDIEKLLNSIDRGNIAGKRDYAVILLALQLGLRVTDIAELKLNNLKWEHNEIVIIQHKNRKRTVYPLLKEVGWAIADYLRAREDIKIDNPYVFVKINAPYDKLQRASVGYILYRRRLYAGLKKKSGVTCGMHSLRHALARRLLANNTSLYTVADIMGHTSYASSSPYLKTDIEGMRVCALSIEEV